MVNNSNQKNIVDTDLDMSLDEIMDAVDSRPVAPPPSIYNKTNQPVILDRVMIQRLGELQCSPKEIAYAMGVTVEELNANYREDIEIGKEVGKLKLKRSMWINAVDKLNPTAQVWLSKNILGYSDNGIQSGDDNEPLPWNGE